MISPLAKLRELFDRGKIHFSLIFDFDVLPNIASARARRAGGSSSAQSFLKRLLGDEKMVCSPAWSFSPPGAVIANGDTAGRFANDPPPPLSWFRLATLSHAGVLTTALRGVKKTR